MTIFLVNLQCQIHGNPISLEKHHGLTHLFLLLHLSGYGHGQLLADPLNLPKAFRLLLNDPESIRLEPPDDPGGQGSSHPFNGP